MPSSKVASRIRWYGVLSSILYSIFLVACSTQNTSMQWGENNAENYHNGQWASAKTRLNRQFQASVHNAYAKKHTIYEILRDYSTNIELDFYDVYSKAESTPKVYLPGDWYVRHGGSDPEEDVNCISDGNQDSLTQCLAEIKRFHNDYPAHDLITIWLDKKQAWQTVSACDTDTAGDCRLPENLDTLLMEVFGPELLFSPGDFIASHAGVSTLRKAADSGWPKMSDLKGKVMVVITDAAFEENTNLNDYVIAQGYGGVAFVAPKMTYGSLDMPEGMNGNEHFVVFYNLVKGKRELGREIFSQNRISRTWGVNFSSAESQDYRNHLIQNGAGDNYSSKYRYTGVLLSE